LLVVHVENDSSLEHDTIFTYPSFRRRPPTQPPPPPEVIPIPLPTTLRPPTTTRPYSQPFHHHPSQLAPTSSPPEYNFKCSNFIITNQQVHHFTPLDVPLRDNPIRLYTSYEWLTQKFYSYLTIYSWNLLHSYYIRPPDPCIVHLAAQKCLTTIVLYNSLFTLRFYMPCLDRPCDIILKLLHNINSSFILFLCKICFLGKFKRGDELNSWKFSQMILFNVKNELFFIENYST